MPAEPCDRTDDHPGPHEWYTPALRRECPGHPPRHQWWRVVCPSCPDGTPAEPRLPDLCLPFTTRFKGVAAQAERLHYRHTGHATLTSSTSPGVAT